MCFGLVKERIKALESNLVEIQGAEPTKEEMMMKQKSRELWLKEGEKNTRFFHFSILQRRQKNRIIEIKLDNGS